MRRMRSILENPLIYGVFVVIILLIASFWREKQREKHLRSIFQPSNPNWSCVAYLWMISRPESVKPYWKADAFVPSPNRVT